MNSTYFCRRCQVGVVLDSKLQNVKSCSATLTLILENLFNEAYMEWDIRYTVCVQAKSHRIRIYSKIEVSRVFAKNAYF